MINQGFQNKSELTIYSVSEPRVKSCSLAVILTRGMSYTGALGLVGSVAQLEFFTCEL